MIGTIHPMLWFDGTALDAATFYCDVFPDARIVSIAHYPEGAGAVAGTVLTVEWAIGDSRFVGLNGGPRFSFTEAVSFVVRCADQAEVDRYWAALTADGGEESMCGWLKDRFGLSWQVIPDGLEALLADPDPGRAQRATAAMMQMRKIDLGELERAADAPA